MLLLEHERFHDDRHDPARRDRRANVNVVEVAKLETVERDEVAREVQLLAQYSGEGRGDVAVGRDDEGPAVRGGGDPFGERVDPRVLRLAFPFHRESDRPRSLDRSAESYDRHVAQWKRGADA